MIDPLVLVTLNQTPEFVGDSRDNEDAVIWGRITSAVAIYNGIPDRQLVYLLNLLGIVPDIKKFNLVVTDRSIIIKSDGRFWEMKLHYIKHNL